MKTTLHDGVKDLPCCSAAAAALVVTYGRRTSGEARRGSRSKTDWYILCCNKFCRTFTFRIFTV